MKSNTQKFTLFPYICFVLFLAFLLLRFKAIFLNSASISGIEQNVVYSIQTLIATGKLYLSPSAPPFSVTQYTPLYYYLCAFTAKTIGCTPDNFHLLYTIGRSWSLVFNLLTAVLIYIIGRHRLLLSKNKSYFLFIVTFSFNSLFYFAVRPDALCDMLAVASINCFMLYLGGSKKGLNSLLLLIFTVFLTACSVFSKQSGIQVIVMFSVFCLFIKDYKTLLRIIISSAIIYAGFLLLFYNSSHYFLNNTVGGIANGISLHWFFKFLVRKGIFLISYLPVIIISVFVILKNKLLFKGTITERALCFFVLFTLLFAFGTSLKMGSGINYYTVFIDISLILIFKNIDYEFDSLSIKPLNKSWFYIYMAGIILLNGLYHYKLLNDFKGEKDQQDAMEKVVAFIKKNMDNSKYVFSHLTTDTDIPSRHYFNNIFYKNALVPEMDILLFSTAKSKVLDYKKLEDMIRGGQVQYIVESRPNTEFRILDNLTKIESENYVLVADIEGYLIYKYK